ncbi:MAG: VWA domain-containing protein [Candidatus Sulfotelmatobacter sp.]|jgi:VWFA-related protein
MFTRCFACVIAWLLLFSGSTFGQTHGGGGVHSPSSSTSSANTNSPTPRSSNSSIPGPVSIASADDEGKIEFRTETILVQVPIVITDKSGNHIHALTKEDFHVFENGKEQKLSTFEEIVSTNTKLPVVTQKPGEFSNLTLSEQEPRTVTVVALDTVNTPFLDQTYGRRELVKYLSTSLDSGQVLALMIITSHGLQIVQGLTGDPAQLMQVLKKASGEVSAMQSVSMDARADAAAGNIPDVPSVSPGSDPSSAIEAFVERGDAIYAQFQQQNAIETTMNAFLGIAWALSGIPGRKSVIWATGGFPFTISSPAAVPGGYLSALYERAMAALAAAQISVYPVDVRGLVSTSPIGDATRTNVRTGAALGRQISNRSWLQQSSIDTLNEFADMTGGKAFYNTNDLASSFKRAADDASSYYLVGYYLDKSNNHAGWRQLKVKVDKKDTEIRARKGFFVTNATIHLERTRTSDLSYALTSPIEGTGVPVTVKWLGISGDGAKKIAEFHVHLPPNSVSIEGSEGQNHLNFDLAVAAFDDNSKKGQPPAVTIGRTITTAVPDAQMAALRNTGIGMKNTIALGPGQYTVRVVIRDNVTGKIGSVTTPLIVD